MADDAKERTKEQVKERTEKLRKDKWIEASMMIEAIAIAKDVVEASLREHVEKLGSVRDAYVFEKTFHEALEVEKPLKNIEKAYSQIVEVKFFARNVYSLLTIIILYGPSSIEILNPHNVTTPIDELQQISNATADLIHQFAAAGAGGIVLSQRQEKK